MPTSMIATISSEVPTGRSMKIRDGFMSRAGLVVGGLRGATGAAAPALAIGALALAVAATLAVRRGGDAWRAGRVRRRPADLGAVAQPVDAVDRHQVADLEAPEHRDL